MRFLKESPVRSFIFHDVAPFATIFPDWPLYVTQLEPRLFTGKVTWCNLGEILIFKITTNCKVEILGQKPKDALLFMTPIAPVGQVHFTDATPIDHNCIFGFNPQRPMNFVTASQGGELIGIKVSHSLFSRWAKLINPQGLETILNDRDVIRVEEKRIASYLSDLYQVLSAPDTSRKGIKSAQMATPSPHQLLTSLLGLFNYSLRSPQTVCRAEIVESARDYMQKNLHRSITLEELSQEVFVSRRTLIYGFQDIYGMGPIAYLKCQRLNRVRAALHVGHSTYETVTNIARLWGFGSLGHFAKEYRLMFKESPSATLKRDVAAIEAAS